MINWICIIDESTWVNVEARSPQEAADKALEGEHGLYVSWNLYAKWQPLYFTGELTGRVVKVVSEKKLTQNEIGRIGRIDRAYRRNNAQTV